MGAIPFPTYTDTHSTKEHFIIVTHKHFHPFLSIGTKTAETETLDTVRLKTIQHKVESNRVGIFIQLMWALRLMTQNLTCACPMPNRKVKAGKGYYVTVISLLADLASPLIDINWYQPRHWKTTTCFVFENRVKEKQPVVCRTRKALLYSYLLTEKVI